MANTPQDFKKKLKEFSGRKIVFAVASVVGVMGTIVRRKVAERTPILTGRAAASWNVNLNVPNLATKPTTYNNPSGAVNDGTVTVAGATIGDSAVVSNNVSYIRALNDGSSQKAPAGFVETTLAEIRTLFPTMVIVARKLAGL